jgi:hypothetical protein
MFGFNLAAAHNGLRHTLAFSFMVSDTTAGGEGWKLIEGVPAENMCENYPKSQYVSQPKEQYVESSKRIPPLSSH